jgi:hypothetical protein
MIRLSVNTNLIAATMLATGRLHKSQLDTSADRPSSLLPFSLRNSSEQSGERSGYAPANDQGRL